MRRARPSARVQTGPVASIVKLLNAVTREKCSKCKTACVKHANAQVIQSSLLAAVGAIVTRVTLASVGPVTRVTLATRTKDAVMASTGTMHNNHAFVIILVELNAMAITELALQSQPVNQYIAFAKLGGLARIALYRIQTVFKIYFRFVLTAIRN
jgi:hypothetical protein